MANYSTNEFKGGLKIMLDGEPCNILENEYVKPGKGQAFNRVKNFVELEITETDPGLKGDTAGTGGKPATLSTGAVVRVPLFVQTGEVIRVDTRSGEYVSRAQK